jgi:beta-carotene 3-hydroxylase
MDTSWLFLILITLVVMEFAVTLFHKHVMHGIGWGWHQSHHQTPKSQDQRQNQTAGKTAWEKNDWFAVVFTVATIAFFAVVEPFGKLWWIAFGVTLYGMLYGILHDVVTHRRLPLKWQPQNPYLRRLVAAHRMHHAVRDREEGVSFGFLYAPPVDVLQRQLLAQRKQKMHAEQTGRQDNPS